MSYGIWHGDAKEMVDPEELRIRAAMRAWAMAEGEIPVVHERAVQETTEGLENVVSVVSGDKGEGVAVPESIVVPVVPMDASVSDPEPGVTPVVPLDVAAGENDGGVAEATVAG